MNWWVHAKWEEWFTYEKTVCTCVIQTTIVLQDAGIEVNFPPNSSIGKICNFDGLSIEIRRVNELYNWNIDVATEDMRTARKLWFLRLLCFTMFSDSFQQSKTTTSCCMWTWRDILSGSWRSSPRITCRDRFTCLFTFCQQEFVRQLFIGGTDENQHSPRTQTETSQQWWSEGNCCCSALSRTRSLSVSSIRYKGSWKVWAGHQDRTHLSRLPS